MLGDRQNMMAVAFGMMGQPLVEDNGIAALVGYNLLEQKTVQVAVGIEVG